MLQTLKEYSSDKPQEEVLINDHVCQRAVAQEEVNDLAVDIIHRVISTYHVGPRAYYLRQWNWLLQNRVRLLGLRIWTRRLTHVFSRFAGNSDPSL